MLVLISFKMLESSKYRVLKGVLREKGSGMESAKCTSWALKGS